MGLQSWHHTGQASFASDCPTPHPYEPLVVCLWEGETFPPNQNWKLISNPETVFCCFKCKSKLNFVQTRKVGSKSHHVINYWCITWEEGEHMHEDDKTIVYVPCEPVLYLCFPWLLFSTLWCFGKLTLRSWIICVEYINIRKFGYCAQFICKRSILTYLVAKQDSYLYRI